MTLKRITAVLTLLVLMICIVRLITHTSAARADVPRTYDVQLEHAWIPMHDGVRLAAWLFKPADAAAGEKFPAILKLAPYRNDDNPGNIGDCEVVRYWVSHGYVGACVDIRGTGRSEGHTPPREYSQQELNDGEEIIAWLARQPWSSGSVGVYGISWTGFNGLRLAMRHPPALKAVISAMSTEVLYNEDCHYTDGISTIVDEYNVGIDSENGRSPSPDFPTDEKTLENRFDNTPWTLVWMRHQRDSEFWHESQEPLESIQVPVFLIGGFLDTYRDTIPRWVSKVRSPLIALIGPWNHTFPDEANPAPGIEWKESLALRWWDKWLKGKETGIMSEPKLMAYMRHWYPPDPTINENAGEWRAEKGWPPQGQKIEDLYLRSDHSLNKNVSSEGVHILKYVPSVGAEAGEVWGEISPDQRPVDAYSLVYDSAPLEKEVAILGLPQVRLRASATAPQADWFIRLNDVAPDGQVTQITGGGLNGAQRDSMSDPKELEPGKIYSLRVPMRFTSWVFPVGHRIRVSISNAQWPMFWPTPYSMTTSLYVGGEQASRLLLPTVPLASPLPAPNFKSLPPIKEATSVSPTWTLQRSMFGKPTTIETGTKDYSRKRQWPWGDYSGFGFRRLEVSDNHPELASYTGQNEFKLQRPERDLHWHSEWDIHSDKTNFYYRFKRELQENGKLIREKEWKETIPRDHQ